MAKAVVPKRRLTKSRTGKRRSHLQRKLMRSTGLWGILNKKRPKQSQAGLKKPVRPAKPAKVSSSASTEKNNLKAKK